jgi:hypothetical protein
MDHWIRLYPEYITDSIEEIKAYVKPPLWTSTNLTINVNRTKDKAKEHHEETLREQANDPNTLCIYTDGPGIAEHIGAAVYSPTTQSIDHEYLGRHDYMQPNSQQPTSQ